jgi:hypothetical protein
MPAWQSAFPAHSSASALRTHLVPLMQLAVLTALVCAACSSQLSLLVAPADSGAALLPLRALLLLEASTTLLALLLPLLKLRPALVPLSLTLPSPSHAPRIVDALLPWLPPSLVDGLTGRAATTRTRRRRRRGLAGAMMGVPPPGAVEELQERRRAQQLAAERQEQQARQAAAPLQEVPQQQEPGQPRELPPLPRAEPYTDGPGLHAPLVMPATSDAAAATGAGDAAPSAEASSAEDRQRDTAAAPAAQVPRPKAPRLHGVRVRVETVWLAETLLELWARVVGAVMYAVITVSRPVHRAPLLLSLTCPAHSSPYRRSRRRHCRRCWRC